MFGSTLFGIDVERTSLAALVGVDSGGRIRRLQAQVARGRSRRRGRRVRWLLPVVEVIF